jgi:hypothetical protein
MALGGLELLEFLVRVARLEFELLHSRLPNSMRLFDLAPLCLLALPLMSCASSEKTENVTIIDVEDSAEPCLPEVRYYVIADT